MSKIKRFNEFVNEGVVTRVSQMILENTQNFVDQVEITDNDISDFKQRQEEILQKYPSLSDLDRDNITNRMNSIIGGKSGGGEMKVAQTATMSNIPDVASASASASVSANVSIEI